MSDTYPDAQPQSYECPRPDSISVDPFADTPSPISSEQLASYQTEIAECIAANSGCLREAVLALIEPVWLAIDEGDKILAKCRKAIELPVKRCLSENDRILRWVVNDLQAYVANAVAENQIALNTLQTEIILGEAIQRTDESSAVPSMADLGQIDDTPTAPSAELRTVTSEPEPVPIGVVVAKSESRGGSVQARDCCDISIPDPRKINRQDLERVNASMPPWTGTVDLVPPGIDPGTEPDSPPPPEDF